MMIDDGDLMRSANIQDIFYTIYITSHCFLCGIHENIQIVHVKSQVLRRLLGYGNAAQAAAPAAVPPAPAAKPAAKPVAKPIAKVARKSPVQSVEAPFEQRL